MDSPSSSSTSQPNTLNISITNSSLLSSSGEMQVSPTSPINKQLLNLVHTKSQSSRKRKGQLPSPVSQMYQKKIKTTIIDCPVALKLLKELGLGKSFFNSGQVLAWALDPTDPAFIRINDYVSRGQGHWFGGVKILGILEIMAKVNTLQDAAIPSDFNEDPRNTGQLRKTLWHGTGSANVPKILQNGLKLPKHDYCTLYGKGIYFADRIDLSLSYCRNKRAAGGDTRFYEPGKKVYLFLCDVMLGNEIYKTSSVTFGKHIKLNWPWQPSKILTAVDSIQGRGSWIPNPAGDQMVDGCVWPMGEGMEDRSIWFPVLRRNIFVVYNEMRVIPKYLVQVEFTEKPVKEKLY